MEVILLEKIRHLGALGEKVKVKSGFGRNYLIPKGKAAPANPANLQQFEARRAELEKVEAEKREKALAKQAQLAALSAVTLTMKAGEEGKLFGSVGTRDIADAITKAGVPVEKSDVILSAGTLRQVGEYDIAVELESDVVATIKLVIAPETHA